MTGYKTNMPENEIWVESEVMYRSGMKGNQVMYNYVGFVMVSQITAYYGCKVGGVGTKGN